MPRRISSIVAEERLGYRFSKRKSSIFLNNSSSTITVVDDQNVLADDTAFEFSLTAPSDAAGSAVTFKNTYYRHEVSLKKVVNGYEPYRDAKYDFEVRFRIKDGESALTEDEIAAILENGKTYQVPAGTSNTIIVQLVKDETITFVSLPQKVTGVELKETSGQPEDGRYTLSLDRVTLNGNPQTASGQAITINLLEQGNSADNRAVFENRYTENTGTLQITKNIVDKEGKLTEIDESRIFTFRVEKLSSDGKTESTFYKNVTVNQGTTAYSAVIPELPVGIYRISEFPTVKYRAYGDKDVWEVTVKENETQAVLFQNYRTADEFFTDITCIVNEVTEKADGTGCEYKGN